MLEGEAAEEFGDVLLQVIGADGLLLDSSQGQCVLADLLCAGQCFFDYEMRQKGENSCSSWWSSS